MIPGFRRAPRRDAQMLPWGLGDLQLWKIFKSELAQGRTGAAYAQDRKDTETGGHMQGHPMVDMVQRSDTIQSGSEAIQYFLNRRKQRERNRQRSDDLDGNLPLDAKATVIGRYAPEIRDQLPQVGAGGDLLRRGAQLAGVVGRDLMKQGPQNIYWFANAPEALASVGAVAAQHGVLKASKGRRIFGKTFGAHEAVSPASISNDVYRTPGAAVASAIPLIGLIGLASGTLNRHEGYKALYPETGEGADPRESTNPVLEMGMRVVGRGGNLLSYKDFVRERPDVSKGEYTAYQAYMQGNRSPVKATTEGIHGAELTMFGKSIPLLTGLVPLAAGLVGARRGYRMAGNRLAGRGIRGRDAAGTRRPDAFQALEKAYEDLGRARQPREGKGGAEDQAAHEKILKRAKYEAGRQQRNLDNSLVAGSLMGSSLGIGSAVTVTQGLEQLRRANNWEENREAVAISVLEAEEERRKEAEAAAEVQAAVAATGRQALAGLATLEGR